MKTYAVILPSELRLRVFHLYKRPTYTRSPRSGRLVLQTLVDCNVSYTKAVGCQQSCAALVAPEDGKWNDVSSIASYSWPSCVTEEGPDEGKSLKGTCHAALHIPTSRMRYVTTDEGGARHACRSSRLCHEVQACSNLENSWHPFPGRSHKAIPLAAARRRRPDLHAGTAVAEAAPQAG